jgi:hypothetical protein
LGSHRRLEDLRLFSAHTRHYLRRRAWRYFRRLGQEHPERYVPAVAAALKLYEDEDVGTGLALLDNWGLMHILFHHSPALVAKTNGWRPAAGRSLAELTPAPICEALWRQTPRMLWDLAHEARCRPVRQWAIRFLRRDLGTFAAGVTLDDVLALLTHEDAEVVALAAASLRYVKGIESLPVSRWLELVESAQPAGFDTLCELMQAYVRPEQVTLEEAVRLACSRPLPVARVGLVLLQGKQPGSEADCRTLLGLVEAPAEPVRPDLVRWARGVLGASPLFQSAWVLEYLDSRHADVRAEGWTWLKQEPGARDDFDIWKRLLESPYEDLRLKLVAELERRVADGTALISQSLLDQELIRFLWASVLLNIHRGGRAKPLVVQQIVRRVERRPEEAAQLLPILSAALRSVRGPEWRAGLAGVVQLAERRPDLQPAIRSSFPELQLEVA